MKQLAGVEIRDFRIRGNYFSQRSLLSWMDSLSLKDKKVVPKPPGYSPPVVEFETEGPDDGATGSIVVREIDLPLLCQDDFEKAKGHLALILRAQQGDPKADKDLSGAVQEHLRGLAGRSARVQPAESRFVVPSTSCGTYSEQAISHKGTILLKLSQLGYPVPDFAILTAQAYADRAQHLEEHLSDAIQQLEILTMQSLGDSENPLVFAMRCATAHYIPGFMHTFLNVGVTESTMPCLEKIYGPVAAHKMFLNNLRNLCVCLDREGYAAIAGANHLGHRRFRETRRRHQSSIRHFLARHRLYRILQNHRILGWYRSH